MEGSNPPSLERLRELETGLNAVSYKTKIGKKLAQQLYRSVKLQLTGPEDIMGILLYDVPVHWSSILREEPVAYKDGLAEDVEEILKALFKWLGSIGYVEGWSVDGEEDWDYTIGISYETGCRDVIIGMTISDKVETWLEYYSNRCGRRDET